MISSLVATTWSRLEASVRQDGGVVVVRNASDEVQGPAHKDATLKITDVRRDRGLDETLSQTFPCCDALSSIPDPSMESSKGAGISRLAGGIHSPSSTKNREQKRDAESRAKDPTPVTLAEARLLVGSLCPIGLVL